MEDLNRAAELPTPLDNLLLGLDEDSEDDSDTETQDPVEALEIHSHAGVQVSELADSRDMVSAT